VAQRRKRFCHNSLLDLITNVKETHNPANAIQLIEIFRLGNIDTLTPKTSATSLTPSTMKRRNNIARHISMHNSEIFSIRPTSTHFNYLASFASTYSEKYN